MIEYDLALDEPRKDDKHAYIEGFTFIYDKKASDEIGQFVKIDYVQSQGLKLINQSQTLAYAQQLKNAIT
ncbi:hypothetical protein [Halalkalibacter nanhaiisediminis]|uniref:hypothetical protein n=1 Tax=Halalkalibacter nanhaiisediminis TaxID=688079 RepID=UPI0011A6D695|nr:hypothetical protein [Halalkalibacter nanhaiisediminis]